MENDKLVLFLHIPKTAGTTVNRMILDQYSRENIAFLHEEGEWSTNKLVDVCNRKSRELQIISGHFPYGLHERLDRTATYMTFLRHPMELLLSMYHFFLRTPSIPTSQQVSQMSFAQFAQSADFDFLTSNLQTRYLCGHPDGFRHPPAIDSFLWKPGDDTPDLERAKEHLSAHFSFVGITEWSAECFAAMRSVLGWRKSDRVYRENVTTNRPAVADLDEGIQEILREKNQLDLQLYEFAGRLYRHKFAAGIADQP